MKISFSSNVSATLEEGNLFINNINANLNNRRRSIKKIKKKFNYYIWNNGNRFYSLLYSNNIRLSIF